MTGSVLLFILWFLALFFGGCSTIWYGQGHNCRRPTDLQVIQKADFLLSTGRMAATY